MTRRELMARIVAAAEPVYGPREAAAIARLVALRRYGLTRADCALDPGEPVKDDNVDEFEKLLTDLAAARPVQYILGTADFDGRELAVGEGVLIPRPETEELVRWIAEDSRRESMSVENPPRILDIGTGSGAIAIALAKRLPGARVTAIDISSEALRFARLNNERTAAGVEILRADILNPESLPFSILNSQFSIIVSNPPYIPETERNRMAPNVTEYEPATALFVPDADPLLFYREIVKFARRNLAPGGALYFEIHETAAEATVELLQAGGFSNTELRNDLNSKPRMIKGSL